MSASLSTCECRGFCALFNVEDRVIIRGAR
jgi:hypothetical protein